MSFSAWQDGVLHGLVLGPQHKQVIWMETQKILLLNFLITQYRQKVNYKENIKKLHKDICRDRTNGVQCGKMANFTFYQNSEKLQEVSECSSSRFTERPEYLQTNQNS